MSRTAPARPLPRLVATTLAVGLLALAWPPAQASARTSHAPSSSRDGAGSESGKLQLVLDSSGSMKEPAAGGTTKIAAAKSALTEVVGGLPDGADVGLRVFGAKVFSRKDKGACTDSQLVVPTGTGNRAALTRAIKDYRPYGETPIGYALRQAAKDLGSTGERSIVLVSDGIATCRPDPCKVAGELAQQGIDLKIDVVGLGVSGKARSQLRCIAEQGNGTYYDARSAGDISDSLSRVSSRAVQPFTLDGTPISGSKDADKPEPLRTGVWSDTLPPGAAEQHTLHYRFTRTIPDSTVHLSVTSTGQPGSDDGIEGVLTAPDASTCDTVNDVRQLDKSQVLGMEAISQDDRAGTQACRSAKHLDFALERFSKLGDKAVPVSIIVLEEPPVTDVDSLPESVDSGNVPSDLPAPGASPKRVIGGSSFPSAPLLKTGTYAGNVVPGEAQVFRVHLGWGQRLSYRFRFPEQTPALFKRTGVQGPFATARTYDPLRAALDDLVGEPKGTDFATSDHVGSVVDETYPVRYRSRSISSTVSSYPGDYYVALSVNDDDGQTYEMPYTLSLAVTGKVSGAPDYGKADADWDATAVLESAGSSSASGATPSPSAAKEGAAPSAAADDSAGSSRTWLVAGGLVLVALLCAAGAFLVLRRGRA